jgi:molybdenum cofactor cytidylyltransferase
MGGRNKLLIPYGETTVVGVVVKTLFEVGLDVIVVTGRDAELVEKAVAPARIVFNPQFEQGMGTSIAAGAREVPDGNSILIALGDMPALIGETVEAIIASGSDDKIVVPHYLGAPDVPGHPVLFGASFKWALTRLQGDDGARAVIQANPESVVTVHFRGALKGIDTPRDL